MNKLLWCWKFKRKESMLGIIVLSFSLFILIAIPVISFIKGSPASVEEESFERLPKDF